MSERREQGSSPREAIVQTALSHLGDRAVPYRGSEYGRDPIGGFDCSGFVRDVLIESGTGVYLRSFETLEGDTRIIRHANEFFDHYGIYIPYGRRQAADLVFFSRDGTRPQHVGIMIDRERYIHAVASDGEVVVSTLEQIEIENLAEDAIYRENPIGFKRPALPIIGSKRWTQKPI